jgi:hypothetical protein
VDHAESLAATITGEQRRAQALIMAVVGGGDIERAEALLEHITDPRWRVRALIELAIAAEGAHARRFVERATACCDLITFTEQKAVAQAEVAMALARSGDLTKAEAVARKIVIPRWRDQALIGMVSIADLAKARAVADTISDTDLKAQALADIAARSSQAEARQLIVQVLRLHKWAPTLGVLARIEPGTVLAIGDDFLRSHQPWPAADRRSE